MPAPRKAPLRKPRTSGGRPALSSRDGPLYEQLAASFAELISSGTLDIGDQLPSVRKARQQFGVSAATVIEAYRRLEARGLISARPQSGYYVRRREPGERLLPQTAPPAPRTIDLRTRPIQDGAASSEVHLRAATPDPALLPSGQLARAMARVCREHPELLSVYFSAHGHESLRRAIARRMLDAGCAVAPADILITNGATESVYLALRAVTEPGDTVAVESPTYFGLLQTLRAANLRVLALPTSPTEGLCLESLERAARKQRISAAILIPNFANPLGSVMPPDRKHRLVELAREHRVPIIEDDIYGEMAYAEPRPPALQAFDPERRTVIYCSSFSKVLSPGARIAWCIAGRWHERILDLKRGLNEFTPLPIQLAIAELLEGGGFDRHLRRMRRVYRASTDRFIDRVLATFPRGTRTSQPQGGHVVWVELPEGIDTDRLLEATTPLGVTFAPGSLFTPDGSCRNFLRLNTAVPWTDAVSDAIATIGRCAGERLQDLARGGPHHKARPITSL